MSFWPSSQGGDTAAAHWCAAQRCGCHLHQRRLNALLPLNEAVLHSRQVLGTHTTSGLGCTGRSQLLHLLRHQPQFAVQGLRGAAGEEVGVSEGMMAWQQAGSCQELVPQQLVWGLQCSGPGTACWMLLRA
jgi:hypothetical protein